jgi:hypothetical protein
VRGSADVRAPLRALLDELDDRLRAFGAPVVEAFRPGVRAEGVHDDVATWFGWHDGAAADEAAPDYEGPGIYFRSENTLVGPWHVISLRDATRIRRWWRANAPQLVPEPWFPVLQFEGVPVLCADERGALHVVDETPLEAPQFDSLADFVLTVLTVFDEGLVVRHPEDGRAPWFDGDSLRGDQRRLCFW